MVKRPKTAIECLDLVLADTMATERLYAALLNNVWVQALGTFPRPEDMVLYLRWLRRGFVWVQKRLGREAMPKDLRLAPAPPPVPGYGPDFALYWIQRDAVVIGLARVAQDAFVSSWDELRGHEGLSFRIPAWLHAMLIPIEECFHRYQLKVLKRPVPEERISARSDHPFEAEARVFVEKAARELMEQKPAR